MTDKRRQAKAQRELEETKILVDYLLAHDLSFDVIEHFSDQTVRIAKEWYEQIDRS